MILSPEEKASALNNARVAFLAYQDSLRRMGAVGRIVVGLDPDREPHLQFWARSVMNEPGGIPVPVTVVGFASGIDALAALCDEAGSRKRRGEA